MTEKQEGRAKVSFKRRGSSYQGSAALQDLDLLQDDRAETMRIVTGIYERSLREIRRWQLDAKRLQLSKTPLWARKAWELGDIVHRLQIGFADDGCRLENLYDHVARQAGTSELLGRFVSFRRYVNSAESVPDCLEWNGVAKRQRTAGLSIAAGLPEDG